MKRWKPNLAGAGLDIAFAVGALAAGWIGANLYVAGLVLAAAIGSWAWTRRSPLAAMPAERRFTQGAIAVAMIAAVLGVAYWIGLRFGGHS